jgi:hypothetical protein
MLLGFILCSFIYLLSYFNILLYLIIFLGIVLFVSKLIFVKSLNSFLDTEVYLNKEMLKINDEAYMLNDIREILIKRTANKSIREIRVKLKGNKLIYISALEKFEDFWNELQGYISRNIDVREQRELIDYDHPIIYLSLVVILSFITVGAIKAFILIDTQRQNYLYYVLSLYVAITGISLAKNKPISKRIGIEYQFIDYILGMLIIIVGIVIFLYRK